MISFLHRKASAITGLIISLVIPTLPLSAFSAQKITAGAPCTKLNTKAVANNKTYTCIKKGSKLVWNSGVAIKSAAPAPSPTPTPTSTANTESSQKKEIDLSRDPRISNVSTLSPVAICKTADNTPDYTQEGPISRNGFPRPKENLYPSNKARILVIPFAIDTWPFSPPLAKNANQTMTNLDLLKISHRDIEKLFQELSAGNFEVEFSILPENEWWSLDSVNAFNSTPMTDNFGPIKELIKKNDGKIDFEKYDSYVFVSALQAPVAGVAQATYTTDVKTSKGKANKLVLITAGWQNPPLYFHELGHSLFGLEDLYLQRKVEADWLPSELAGILPWDLMADSNISFLSNWNRLLMGWLQDSDIRCLTDQEKTTHYLSYFTTKNQPKLLLINLAKGVTLAAETRNTGTNQGLLLYVIDTNLAHGEIPLRALNYLVKAGETKELFDWKFSVTESSKDGLLVEVTKTLGKKYVAPVSIQRSNNVGSDGKVRLQQSNIVETGYLTAKGTFDAVNFNSYRVFVTASDEPKKILFDTGIVNSSANPLEVEITGLVCGKDFITTSQFWKERDGKGELAEVASPQLRRWQCK